MLGFTGVLSSVLEVLLDVGADEPVALVVADPLAASVPVPEEPHALTPSTSDVITTVTMPAVGRAVSIGSSSTHGTSRMLFFDGGAIVGWPW
ncbi:hypothetical protein ACMYYO_09005 [Dermacoccaceae bacterium W4C1]